MRRRTTLAMVLILLGGIAGCGGSAASGPPYHYSAQQKQILLGACEREMHETSNRFAERASEGCRCYLSRQEATSPTARKLTAGAVLASGCATDQASGGELAATTLQHTETTPQHTPEEEAGRKESLEIQRREEYMKALGQKKVEEAETQGGEHSIRAGEEKVCYESGKTSEECKSPAEKRQRENEAVAQHEQEVASGQLKVTE